MSLFDTYNDGVEILGISAASFVPWLNAVSSVAGGLVGKQVAAQKAQMAAPIAAPVPLPNSSVVQPATSAPQTTQSAVPNYQPPSVDAQIQKALNDDRYKREQQKAAALAKNIRTGATILSVGVVLFILYKAVSARGSVPPAALKAA